MCGVCACTEPPRAAQAAVSVARVPLACGRVRARAVVGQHMHMREDGARGRGGPLWRQPSASPGLWQARHSKTWEACKAPVVAPGPPSTSDRWRLPPVFIMVMIRYLFCSNEIGTEGGKVEAVEGLVARKILGTSSRQSQQSSHELEVDQTRANPPQRQLPSRRTRSTPTGCTL